MPFDFNTFINPGQFSDPANYSGFNGQMKSVEDVAKEAALASVLGPSGGGIAPPTNEMSVGDSLMNYGKQAIAPAQQSFNKLSSKASNVFGGLPNQQPQQTQQEQQSGWNLRFHD